MSTPTTAELLQRFAAQPGCESYRTDAAKVKLLCEYLWARTFMPGLTLEQFLVPFETPDGAAETRKHPQDVLNVHCPTRGKEDAPAGVQAWSAKARAGILMLYVDGLRFADAATPKVSLDTFLGAVKDAYLAGEFTPETDAPAAAQNNSRRIYETEPGGRQYRGQLLGTVAAEDGRMYADFQSDAGEIFRRVPIDRLLPCDDPLPQPPTPVASYTYPIPRTAETMLRSPPVAAGVGDSLYEFSVPIAPGVMRVCVRIGLTGTYVDACLESPGHETIEVPPRKNLEGNYWFEMPEGHYLVTLTPAVEEAVDGHIH